jgi:hypothetical protein
VQDRLSVAFVQVVLGGFLKFLNALAEAGSFLAPKRMTTMARIATISHPFRNANIVFINSGP